MPGNPFKKVVSGERLQIHATAWNRLMDVAARGEDFGIGQAVAQCLRDNCRETNVVVEDEHAEFFSFCHGFETGFPLPLPRDCQLSCTAGYN